MDQDHHFVTPAYDNVMVQNPHTKMKQVVDKDGCLCRKGEKSRQDARIDLPAIPRITPLISRNKSRGNHTINRRDKNKNKKEEEARIEYFIHPGRSGKLVPDSKQNVNTPTPIKEEN